MKWIWSGFISCVDLEEWDRGDPDSHGKFKFIEFTFPKICLEPTPENKIIPASAPTPPLNFFSGTTHASIIITRFKIKHTMYMYIDLRV